MKTSVFSIFDSKAHRFLLPFFAPNSEVAKRSVAHATSNLNTDFGRFPGDYTLFRVGLFDDEKGEIETLCPIMDLGNLLTFKQEVE